MISVNLGCCFNFIFLAYRVINPFKLISLELLSDATNSKEISPQHCINLSFSELYSFELALCSVFIRRSYRSKYKYSYLNIDRRLVALGLFYSINFFLSSSLLDGVLIYRHIIILFC